MPSLSTKERKAMLNKLSNYLIPLLSWIDIESTDIFFLIQRMNTIFQELHQNIINSFTSLKKLKEDKLRQAIEEIKDELKRFKTILNEIEKLNLLRKQKINEIKNEIKRKLNTLDDEISEILEKLDVNLTTLELRCSFCKKPHDFEKETELKLSVKEKINETERLKENVENNKDELLDQLLMVNLQFLNY